MVLETILSSDIKKPLHVFALGIVFSSVAILIANSLFSHSPSMVIVSFMTLPSIYVFTKIIKQKSEEELKVKKLKDLFTSNTDIVTLYLSLFLGMTIGIAVWFSLLPSESLSSVFSEQLYNLKQLGVSTSLTISSVSSAVNTSVFWIIASNNIKLVMLCGIMSFIFGAGALFILAWNASVVGAAVGILIYKLKIAGMATPIALLNGLATGTSYYILHLVPEVLAYFLAAIAGGIISASMMRYKPFSNNSNKLLFVSAGLIVAAIALVFIGAVVETGVSHPIQAMIAASHR